MPTRLTAAQCEAAATSRAAHTCRNVQAGTDSTRGAGSSVPQYTVAARRVLTPFGDVAHRARGIVERRGEPVAAPGLDTAGGEAKRGTNASIPNAPTTMAAMNATARRSTRRQLCRRARQPPKRGVSRRGPRPLVARTTNRSGHRSRSHVAAAPCGQPRHSTDIPSGSFESSIHLDSWLGSPSARVHRRTQRFVAITLRLVRRDWKLMDRMAAIRSVYS